MIDLSEMKGIHVDPERTHDSGAGRRDLGRVQPRSGGSRAGRDRWRDLDHRDRRPTRSAAASAGSWRTSRARRRQPARGRARHRERRRPERRPPTRIPTSSGRSEAAAATSESRRRSCTGCTRVREVVGGADRLSVRRRGRRAALLPRRHGVRHRTSSRSSSRLVHAPDGSGAKLAALVVCHAGSPEQAEEDLAPLRAFGSPLMMEVGPMPYPVMNTLLDAAYPGERSTTGSRAS